jgi:cytochrome c553
VPVEADGSAHFVVPARKELYFQALDAQGLAVTSMRSGTHFLPGERAMCQGCHEPKHRSPPATGLSTRLALRRPPSRIQPEVEGSNPISYPRLVQPVLDANCVACHAKNAGKAPPLDRSLTKIGNTEYFASYKSLAQKYGFYSYPDYHRTTPGQFGARASKLYELLQKGHHDVKLPAEPMRRITLWLDSVSVFYGVYEPEGQMVELSGRLARPTLE